MQLIDTPQNPSTHLHHPFKNPSPPAPPPTCAPNPPPHSQTPDLQDHYWRIADACSLVAAQLAAFLAELSTNIEALDGTSAASTRRLAKRVARLLPHSRCRSIEPASNAAAPAAAAAGEAAGADCKGRGNGRVAAGGAGGATPEAAGAAEGSGKGGVSQLPAASQDAAWAAAPLEVVNDLELGVAIGGQGPASCQEAAESASGSWGARAAGMEAAGAPGHRQQRADAEGTEGRLCSLSLFMQRPEWELARQVGGGLLCLGKRTGKVGSWGA